MGDCRDTASAERKPHILLKFLWFYSTLTSSLKRIPGDLYQLLGPNLISIKHGLYLLVQLSPWMELDVQRPTQLLHVQT